MTAQHSHTCLSAAGLVTCLLALLAGCGTEPEKGGLLAGTWIGQTEFTVPGGPTVPASITLVTVETSVPRGIVKGEIIIEAAGQTGCGPVTGNHEYPDFSLDFNFALAGEEVTGGYVGKATIHNCTSKFGRPEWCGMEGTFTTHVGTFSEALTLTGLRSGGRSLLDPFCIPPPF